MAAAHEKSLAAMLGMLAPPGARYVQDNGVLPLPPADPAGFDFTFLGALEEMENLGFPTWPVHVIVNRLLSR